MKLLFDFFPIILFFSAYKLYDIYTATIVLMVASLIQTIAFCIKYRKIDFTYTITLVLVLIFGAATLYFRNELFIKWKPTAIYWAFAILFLGSQVVGTKPLLQRLMGNKITLPKNIWKHLNLSWVVFFRCMGAVNLYVAYEFSTSTWVNFKLFGTLGGTVFFGLLQSLYMAKHLKNSQD